MSRTDTLARLGRIAQQKAQLSAAEQSAGDVTYRTGEQIRRVETQTTIHYTLASWTQYPQVYFVPLATDKSRRTVTPGYNR